MNKTKKLIQKINNSVLPILFVALMLITVFPARVINAVTLETSNLSADSEREITSSNGDKYNVSLTYDEADHIPENSTLNVEEIDSENTEFIKYGNIILENFRDTEVVFKLYAISILNNSEIIVPETELKLSVDRIEDEEESSENAEEEFKETQTVVFNESKLTVLKEETGIDLSKGIYVFGFVNEVNKPDNTEVPEQPVETEVSEYEFVTSFVKEEMQQDNGLLEVKEIKEEGNIEEYKKYVNKENFIIDYNYVEYYKLFNLILNDKKETIETESDPIEETDAELENNINEGNTEFENNTTEAATEASYNTSPTENEEENDLSVKVELVLNKGFEDLDKEKLAIANFNDDGNKSLIKPEIEENEGKLTLRFTLEKPGAFAIVEYDYDIELKAFEEGEYLITVVYNAHSGISKDAQLFVTEITEEDHGYDEYLEKSSQELGEDIENISYARVFDISLKNPETGEEYQPDNNIMISIELFDDVSDFPEDKTTTDVIHIHGEDEEKVEVLGNNSNGETVEFETDSLSVFVVTKTVKEDVLTASDGNTYKISVEYDKDSGIPDNAYLSVVELDKDSSEYSEYIQKTSKVLGKDSKYFAFAYAFDISLINLETGEHYQPEKDVKVSIELLNESIKNYDGVSVIHFTDSLESASDETNENQEKVGAEIIDNEIVGGTVKFETDGFSVYIVAKDELLKHYVFLNDTDGKMTESNKESYIFNEQVLINGETLVEPAMPSRNGAVFSHWVDASGNEVSFPQIVVIDPDEIEGADHDEKQQTLDNNKTYFYAAYKGSKTLISFYNQSGLVVEKIEIDKPATGLTKTYDTTKVKYVPIQDKEGSVLIFKYWTDDPRGTGTQIGTGGTITITSESKDYYELYPHLDYGHYIYFDSNKSNYGFSSVDFTAPETVIDGATSAQVLSSLNSRENHAIPKTNGYVFKGWYIRSTDKHDNDTNPDTKTNPVFYPNNAGTALEINATEYAKLLNSEGKLPNNPTLYAHWEPETTADYTIVIWRQKLSDDSKSVLTGDGAYAFAESFKFNDSTLSNVVLGDDYKNLQKLINYNAVNPYRTDSSGEHPDNITNNKEQNPYYGFVLKEIKVENEANGIVDGSGNIHIKADSSTVINVYYDRQKFTLTFAVEQSGYHQDSNGQYYKDGNNYYKLVKNGNDYYYLTGLSSYTNNIYWDVYFYTDSGWKHGDLSIFEYNGSDSDGCALGVYNGNVYRLFRDNNDSNNRRLKWTKYTGQRYAKNMTVIQTITEPYGVKIDDTYFPIKQNGVPYGNNNNQARWEDVEQKEYTNVISKVLSMPAQDILFYYSDGSDRPNKTLYYLEEVLENESIYVGKRSAQYNNKTYREIYSFTAKYNWLTENEDVYPFEGRRYIGSTPAFVNGIALKTGVDDSIDIFYERLPYTIYFRDSEDGSPVFGTSGDRQFKYGQSITDFNDPVNNRIPNKAYKVFTGWYLDESCTTRVFFNETSYQNSPLEENKKERLFVMPSSNVILYAGWTTVKNRINIIPNGGELSEDQSVQFHLTSTEKIGLVDPTRDFIPVESDGEYNYDDINGHYIPAELNDGKFNPKSGAYVFLGWYEATLENPGNKKIIEYSSGKYTYAYGNYVQAKESGTGKYRKDGDNYTYVGSGGDWDFENAKPEIDEDGNVKVGSKVNLDIAPQNPVTIVALWQRAGGFRVEYNTIDPDIENAAVAAPEDNEEYIDSSHALVLPAVSAPKGYALEFWTDKNWNPESEDHKKHEYLPNQLVAINEKNAVLRGSELVVTLTAHYRIFDPAERVMADYTFLVDANNDGDYSDEGDLYELQRIAVNEELTAPISPTAPTGYSFKGWYLDKDGKRRFEGFGIISNPTYTTLYAVFEKSFTVTYYLSEFNDNGVLVRTNTVIATQTYRNEPGKYEYLDSRHINHPVDVDHFVEYWVSDWNDKTNPEKQYPYNSLSIKKVEGDMDLYAILIPRTYVFFDSQGGSFVDKQEFNDLNWPVRPQEPTRNGYTFQGWWSQPDGGVEYEFDESLSDLADKEAALVPPIPEEKRFNVNNATLYAKWEPDGTSKGDLNVVWWAQTSNRPNDSDVAKSDDENKYFQMIYSEKISNAATIGTHNLSSEISNLSSIYNLPSDWNNIEELMIRACIDEEFEPSKSFIRSVLELSDNTEITQTHIQNILRKYYQFNQNGYSVLGSSYNNALASSICQTELTIDDNGDAVLNIRFVLKVYKYEFIVSNTNSKGVYVYDEVNHVTHYNTNSAAAPRNGNYSFEVWLNKYIEVQWPSSRNDEGKAMANAYGTDSNKYRGWQSNNSATSNIYAGTTQLYSSKLFIDMIPSNVGILRFEPYYSVTSVKNARIHYIVVDTETEDTDKIYTELSSETYGMTTSTTYSDNCSYTWYGDLYQKELRGYDFFSDLNGEPANSLKHSHYWSDYQRYYPLYDTSSDVPKIAKYRYKIANSYKNITFYTYYRDNWWPWPDDYLYEVTFTNIDGSSISIVDGENYSLNPSYSITSNGATVSSNTTLHYKDSNGNHHSMTYSEYVANVIYKDEKMVSTDPSAVDCHLYFYYVPHKYSLSLYLDGMESELSAWKTESVAYNTQLTGESGILESDSFTPPRNVWPENKEFVGWSEVPGQTTAEYYYNSNDGKMPAYNLSLFAIWKSKEYTVTTIGVDLDGDNKDDTYKAVYNQQLKELNIPNPKVDNKLFKGWLNNATGNSINSVFAIKSDLEIRPDWEIIDVRRVTYDANVPTGLTGGGTLPVDNNAYFLGAKVIIKGSNDLYVIRKNIDGAEYNAPFAYWVDNKGNKYYPNTVYTFRKEATDGLIDTNNDGILDTLALKAIYSEYRETELYYDRNVTDNSSKFVYAQTLADYTGTLVDGKIQVLYRDKIREDFDDEKDMIPNEIFYVAKDQEGKDFTVTRKDVYNNEYVFAGWMTDKDDSLPLAQNGDKAYVNTIKDENGVLRNTLYALWGVCKVVDSNNREHIFDSIHKAIVYINNNGKTGTIEMLIDYRKPSIDDASIPEGCTITITTAAKKGHPKFTGEMFFYIGAGDNNRAIITRAQTGSSMISNNGNLTLTNIVLDGNKSTGSYIGTTCTSNGGLINVTKGKVVLSTGTLLRNSSTSGFGGAAYVSANATIELANNPSLIANTATEGAGIYLVDGATMRISGSPSFSENVVVKNGYSSKQNGFDGGAAYVGNRVHQDIYIDENHENAPSSLVVTGNISGSGTIWVWASNINHYKQYTPFAKIESDVEIQASSLEIFRNAQDDQATLNTTASYLYGSKEGDPYKTNPEGFVYWAGIVGKQLVALRKVNSTNSQLSEKTFIFYKGRSNDPYTRDGVSSENESKPNGLFYVGELSFGTYYLKESDTQWFALVVDKDGAWMSACCTSREAAEDAKDDYLGE